MEPIVRCLTFHGQVFREQRLRPTNDASVDELVEFEQFLLCLLNFFVRPAGISTATNGILEACSKFVGRAENAAVDEMNQAEIFEEIVLNRCAGQQDSTAAIEFEQSVIGLIFGVLQSMALRRSTCMRHPREGSTWASYFIADD